MEYHVESAQAALEKCWELVREGQADLFRGQMHDWPKLIPSIFRVSGADRVAAEQELEEFKSWSRNIPQMAIYGGDDTAITAIAQHYGIPTAFLDLTSNPEIAALFAKSSEREGSNSEAVIYCFLEAGLRSLEQARLVRIDVDNLWRLESQRGLFLQFLDESLTETIRSQAIRIHFPLSNLTADERTRLYPVRKSALESVIDQWFYRRQIEAITENFEGVKYKFMTHRETYPGVFRWRELPELDASWIMNEPAWIFPPIESVSIVADPKVVTLPKVDFSVPEDAFLQLKNGIQGPIRQYRATGELISFVALLSAPKMSWSGSVSTLINRCWDGLRVLPYHTDELIASIALIALYLVARTEGIDGVDDWQELFFGPLKTIEVAPIGGHIEAGAVSEADLRSALSDHQFHKMTAYIQRKANIDPEFPMLYVVDHWMLFSFEKFKKLFVEQFIPTAVDWYWKEDFASYEGALSCLWSLSFNPALLGYVTPFDFRFHSPISGEKDCANIVYVLPDMDRADLEEAFISCMPSILGGGESFSIRFHEYGSDPRPIWKIERVIEQCRWIVEVGGISALEVMPSIMSDPADEIEREFQAIGAFEIWLISKKMLQKVQGKTLEEIEPLLSEFWNELMISNANLETRASSMADWPGPRTQQEDRAP